MSALFSPFTLKGVTLRNRIAVPPMCQYSAVDGLSNDWHQAHYAGIARGGPGLVIVEATAASPEGRISPGCLGLWNNAQAAGLARVAAAIKAGGAVAGIQLAHAGRKASANKPWEGDDHIAADDARGWDTIAPSALAFGGNLPKVPRAMTLEDIARVREDFVTAAQRALAAGFEWLELHFAPDAAIPWGPGFLAPVAARVRTEAGLPVASSWGIDDPQVAERVIAQGQMDLVMIGRAFLSNPHYTYQAALALKKARPSWVLPAPYAHWLEKYQRA